MQTQQQSEREDLARSKLLEKDSRFNLKSAVAIRESKSRNDNSVSMYVNTNEKILPKASTALSIKTGFRPFTQKSKNIPSRSLFRYRKQETTVKEEGFYSSVNPIKQFKRKTMRKSIRSFLRADDKNLLDFYEKVEELEGEFMQKCFEEDYDSSLEVIIRLLNYAVDYNLPEQFSIALKMIADLSILIDKTKEALFYYNEARECCLLMNHMHLLIECLIGMSKCCSKAGLENEGVKILKKALEYAWLGDLKQLELSIYDEIGKNYYHLGEIDRAKKYHYMNINSIHENESSALRMLSKQRIKKSEEINIEIRFKELSVLFLVHLKVPIRSLEEIPLPNDLANLEKPVRKYFNINNKYFSSYRQVNDEVTKIMNDWFFREEIDDPNLPEYDWSVSTKNKKYNYIDFQLNQCLNKLDSSKKYSSKNSSFSKTKFQIKQSLDEQIARKVRQKPMDTDWYEKIVKQINRDHKNKLLNVRHAVRIRGFNKKVKPNMEIIKEIYNKFFEKSKNGSSKRTDSKAD